jgi:hypothetical protein
LAEEIEKIDHQVAVDMVLLNSPDNSKKPHGLMLTLQKFSMNDQALAYVLLSATAAEELGLNLIRLAFISRMNDGLVPDGMDVQDL